MSVRVFVKIAILFLLAALPVFGQTELPRFPDVAGDRVVFTYAGDLWAVSTAGGTAARLTAHPGMEVFAKFSPDGKYIAFTGQYDGDEQVYVVPLPEAGSGDFSPDDSKMIRSPRTRDFRLEKRYGGGQANTLCIYNLATNDAKKISEGVRPSRASARARQERINVI